ncbi:MAG: hypothetical protein A2X69_09215 [Rhodobacteraceae bacterium GWF1_65_7]|nr:MAG: hypothetical protein A2X69_09215 [Rhodobacteraceae bacterium GWF1_65_7]
MCEAKAVYNWVRKNVRYAGDIAPIKQGRRGVVEGVDYFAAADRVVQFGAEDCDGHSILNATLLALNGIPAKLRITAPGRFREWSHIYTVAGMPKTAPKKWVALDTTLPGEYFGVEAPHGRVRDFDA